MEDQVELPQIEVARTQESRVLRSRSVLNISENLTSSPTAHSAVIQDSYGKIDDAHDRHNAPSQHLANPSPIDDQDQAKPVKMAPKASKRQSQKKNGMKAKVSQNIPVATHAQTQTSSGKLNSAQNQLIRLAIQSEPSTAGQKTQKQAPQQTDSIDTTLLTNPQTETQDAGIHSISSQYNSTEDESEHDDSQAQTKRQLKRPQKVSKSQLSGARVARTSGKNVGCATAKNMGSGLGDRSANVSRKIQPPTKRATVPESTISTTPQSAQEARPESSAIARDHQKSSTRSSPLLVRKRKAEDIPLVDENSSKKTVIIAFGDHGPLNQGNSSVHSSAVKQSNRSQLASRNGKSAPDPVRESQKIEPIRSQRVVSRDDDPASYDAQKNHPLAGYAHFLARDTSEPAQVESDAVQRDLTASPPSMQDVKPEPFEIEREDFDNAGSAADYFQVDEIAHLEDGDQQRTAEVHIEQTVNRPQDRQSSIKQDISQNHTRTTSRMLKIAAMAEMVDQERSPFEHQGSVASEQIPEQSLPTASQLAMPPPKVKPKEAGVTVASAAHDAVMHSPRMVSTVSYSPHPEHPRYAPQSDLSEDHEPSAVKTGNEETSNQTTVHNGHGSPPQHGKNILVAEPTHGPDDSGYQSVLAKTSTATSGRIQPAVVGVRVGLFGSPKARGQHRSNCIVLPSMASDNDEASGPADKDSPVSRSGNALPSKGSSNPFFNKQPRMGQAKPTVFTIRRMPLTQDSPLSNLKAEDDDNDPTDLPTEQSSAAESVSQGSCQLPDEIVALEDLEDILNWRNSLPRHLASLFDVLLRDARHLVVQLARREELVQLHIQQFRQGGQSLVEELQISHAREYQRFHHRQ